MKKADEIFDNLPEELRGRDITPEKLEDIKNDFGVMRDRIIITYDKKDWKEVAEYLGLPTVNCALQVTYDFNTIKENRKYGLF